MKDLEEKVENQADELEITRKHLDRVERRTVFFEEECKGKETLRGLYREKAKELERTSERLRVKTQEVSYLKEALLDTSFEAQSSAPAKTTVVITTVAELAEKALEYADGNQFIATVRPRDLPECWGIKIDEIKMPGCSIDLESIKNGLKRNGFQRRAYFHQPVGPKKQQRCMLIPKY